MNRPDQTETADTVATPTFAKRFCPGCGEELVRRPKERPHEFERRRSCLRPECSRIARSLGGIGWPSRHRSPALKLPRPTGEFPADVWYGPDIEKPSL
jgi:hypothetical protein